MKSAVPNQVIETTTPNLDGFEITRRPLIGFGLLISSVIGTLAVLIFFGAWASSDRIENRALAAGISEIQVESEWWEDGLVLACPLH
jgi:hypothetical protein|tara:strand:+ start:691 stop:951 length:261 start_codon:yes stop_codon:yes gene_type:complete